MRLFLTSNGLSNNSIASAFNELVGLPLDKINIAFIPTAANIEKGDKGWLDCNLNDLRCRGYRQVDAVDISTEPVEIWKPRLEKADVLFFGGGNTSYLMHWLIKSGLSELLPGLLKTRVFAGISAGSCVTGKTIINPVQNLFEEKYDINITDGLGLVDFQFVPHLNSLFFENIRANHIIEAAARMKETIYAVDDDTAMMINGEKVDVVGDGECMVFNKR